MPLRKRTRSPNGYSSASSSGDCGVNRDAAAVLLGERRYRRATGSCVGVAACALGAAAAPAVVGSAAAPSASAAAAPAGAMKRFVGEGMGVPVAGAQDATLASKMEAFVEAAVRRELGGGAPSPAAAAAAAGAAGDDAWGVVTAVGGAAGVTAADILASPASLYALPEHLRVARSRGGEAGAGTGTGGMMLGGTGIAEVAVPDAWKARTAVETDRAREAMLARRDAKGGGGGGGGGGAALGGSVSVNFNEQRRERAIEQRGGGGGGGEARPLPAFLGGGGGGAPAAGGDKVDHKRAHANDAQAFSRFKRAELDKGRNR